MKKAIGFGVFAAGGVAALIGAAWSQDVAASESAAHRAFSVIAADPENPGIARCFMPGTDPEVMRQVGEAIYGLNQRFFTFGRWPGTSGTPVNLTYSFPPDGINIPSGVGEPAAPNEIHARMNAIFGGNTAQWKGLIAQALNVFGLVTGNTYTEISDDGAGWGASGSATRGDVRIAMKNIDGGSGTLAYNGFPSSGGDMVLDRSESWGSSGGSFRFLRNVVSHEHGHGLGLRHCCPQNGTKLMEPGLNTNFDGPQQDDIRGVMALYGDLREPNGATANATDLDALGLVLNTPLILNNQLSLHSSSDNDVFSFTAPASGDLSVTVTPVGTTYANGQQNGDGSCSSGAALDALRQQNLEIAVLNSGGGVVPGSETDLTSFGSAEVLSNFSLGALGTFYVRISSAGSMGDVQRYNLRVTIGQEGLFGDQNADGCINGTDLAILLGAWGPTGTTADLNGDGVADSTDLALMLGVWGDGCM